MKKARNILMVFLLLFSQWGVISVEAAGSEADFQTIDNATGVTITKYKGNDVDVEIPAFIQSKPVTAIGDAAFYDKGLRTVIIPDSITSIGDEVFSDNWLESVTLPSNLTYIGNLAFAFNELITIDIPASVKKIDDSAFYYNKLTSVKLSEGIEHIENGAFMFNRLTEIELPNSITYIGDYAFDNNNIKNAKLPNGITAISDSVFRDNQLEHIEIPSSVNTIGDWAFIGNQLTSVTIPAMVKSIGDEAFANNQLHTVRFAGALTLGDDVFIDQATSQFDGWYEDKNFTKSWNNQVLKSMEIYTKDTPVTTTYSVSYDSNGATGTAPLDPTAYNQGDSVTVKDKGDLEKVNHTFTGWNTQPNGGEIPYAVGDTFNMGTGNITLYAQWVGVPSYSVSYDGNGATGTAPFDPTAYNQGDSVTVKDKGDLEKANHTFTGWNTQSNGNGTPYTANDIFQMGTENITLYAQWTAVGNEGDFLTIDNDTGVTIIGYIGDEEIDLVIPPTINGKPVTAIGNRAFYEKYLTAIDMPATITSIGDSAFELNDLTYLELPNSVITIGKKAFADNYLVELDLSVNLTTIGDKAFIGNSLTSIELPDSLTSIGAQAFSMNWLTELRIPVNVTFIGEKAFEENKLEQVDIEATNLLSIEKRVFSGNNIINIKIPNSVTSIGEGAFSSNFVLENVELSTNLKMIGDSAFSINSIKNLVIPEGVETIGKYAFHINKLKYLMIPSSVTTIGNSAFLNNYLSSVRFCGAPSLEAKAFAEQNPSSSTFEWYEDIDYTNLWNGIVAKPMKIYAEGAPNSTTYSVTYNGNGATGTVPEDANAYDTGECVSVAEKGNLAKTGHTFAGWSDGVGNDYATGNIFYMGASNITLYAKWIETPTYKVTYDGNGATEGIVPKDGQLYEEGQDVTVADKGSLVKTGYTFTGWSDGAGNDYAAGTTLKMGASNITLYAKWEANPTYKVTYNGNGATEGTAPVDANAYEEGASVTVANKGNLIKAGYTFTGWNTQADGKGTNYVAGNKFTINTADVVLHAQWRQDNVSGGGGSYVPTPNEPTPEPPIVTPKPNEPKPEQPIEPTPDEHITPTKPITFSDISKHWAKDMIEGIATRGIIKGYPDGTFRPNEPIQRQHIAVMFGRAFTLISKREATPFKDVPSNHPYYEVIMQLQQAEIMDGVNGFFLPEEPLTRAQMAKVLVRAFELPIGGTSDFQDVPATHWSSNYIATLEAYGIALGDNGYFKPDEPVTRAQFVAFMYRAMNIQF
ncbi:leucine-rich repeat protein [Lysinibacillus piscis]|uniref:SLH domain-containing protein n=1 Tax=Lysinibacillus piscis TaxID=2518931 RepID=A0ABQ5NJ05_9BACI|nr:leucine-rich repeat protein [Lysinibacillus sp. KH24]GLC88057.1 hypothetical protein LYSBPC_11840 [Lysinibacillus sp. KH24]